MVRKVVQRQVVERALHRRRVHRLDVVLFEGTHSRPLHRLSSSWTEKIVPKMRKRESDGRLVLEQLRQHTIISNTLTLELPTGISQKDQEHQAPHFQRQARQNLRRAP